MARKQMQIPGTERDDVPPSLLEAGERWLDMRREKRRASDKAKEAKFGVLALMASHKFPKFTLKDPETEEVMELEVDVEPKLRTKKSGEVDTEVGDALPEHAGSSANADGVHPGLIEQATRAQDDANGVEVTEDGDVVTPDRAAPKKKRAKPSKKGRKS